MAERLNLSPLSSIVFLNKEMAIRKALASNTKDIAKIT